ncbi:hypothetical protein [Bradyrhizobium manausense]|uniref:hypothetical protein n=1 Tax=Bradyrhizobium manausense TaxID=989370 RepID=UPI001BAC8452|nr:hypothetical protein [Bradyrhizobium manausense]MBR0727037.1 hypothetical protein [Bradyrhizobium manausense]
MRWGIFLLLGVLAGAGTWYALSGDNLRDIVNTHWPPVTSEQQRQTAIDGALSALEAMPTPNIAAGVDVKTIEMIAGELLKGKGVTKLSVETDRQLLKVTAAFDLSLRPEDAGDDPQKRAWIERLKPQLAGRAEFFLSATTAMVTAPKRAIQVKLLPAFKSLHIDKITLAERYDVTAAGAFLASLLESYADNIIGTLTNAPVLNAELPASLQDQFDPSGPIKINPASGSSFKLTLSSQPVRSPYELGSATLLIDNSRVIVLAQLTPPANTLTAKTASKGAFSDLAAGFTRRMSDGFDLREVSTGAWVAVAKALIADTFNSAFAQAQACIAGTGAIPKQTFEQKIPTPDASAIDCTPRGDCTPTQACDLKEDTRDCRRSRNCQHNHDTRECRKCVVGVCANDPICEAAKASQNAIYDADYTACVNLGPIYDAACEAQKATQNGLYATQKAQCEAEKSTKKLACEAEKTGRKLACETYKGAVDALHRTGNVGNFDGSISGTGDLRICFRDVAFAPDLAKLSMKLETTGSVSLDTSFKFTPLDVAGHILCQLPWTADKNIRVTVPSQSIGVDVTLARSPGEPEYRGQLKASPIRLHFEPSPTSLVLQNINFYLACPVTAQLVNGMTLNLAPFVPELLKDYTHTLDPIDFSFVPTIPDQPLFGRTIKPTASETPKALIVSGAP